MLLVHFHPADEPFLKWLHFASWSVSFTLEGRLSRSFCVAIEKQQLSKGECRLLTLLIQIKAEDKISLNRDSSRLIYKNAFRLNAVFSPVLWSRTEIRQDSTFTTKIVITFIYWNLKKCLFTGVWILNLSQMKTNKRRDKRGGEGEVTHGHHIREFRWVSGRPAW